MKQAYTSDPKAPESVQSARKQRKRIIFYVTAVILSVAILGTMAFIFRMSAENQEESGDRSTHVTEWIAGLFVRGYEDMSEDEQNQVVEDMQHMVRKVAHFSEYALLGALTVGLSFVLFSRRKSRRTKILTALIPIAFCLIYASLDEIHQIFSERGPSVVDVMIDFSGALFGIGLISLIVFLVRRSRAGKEKDVCKQPATD